jgi:hypothetical protein
VNYFLVCKVGRGRHRRGQANMDEANMAELEINFRRNDEDIILGMSEFPCPTSSM